MNIPAQQTHRSWLVQFDRVHFEEDDLTMAEKIKVFLEPLGKPFDGARLFVPEDNGSILLHLYAKKGVEKKKVHTFLYGIGLKHEVRILNRHHMFWNNLLNLIKGEEIIVGFLPRPQGRHP